MNARFREPRWESEKLRKSARDKDCTIRSPWCRNRTETVVWCHSPFSEHGHGMGCKSHDLFGCYGCFECHTYLDLESKQESVPRDERLAMFHLAMCRSLLIIVQTGVLK